MNDKGTERSFTVEKTERDTSSFEELIKEKDF